MRRAIIGIQVHHSVLISDAVRHLVNGTQALAGAAGLATVSAVELLVLREEVARILRRVTELEDEARRRMQELYLENPEMFRAARDGDIPWPDEDPVDFEPRCRCQDRCLVHDGNLAETEWAQRYGPEAVAAECNCDVGCAAHPT